VLLSFAQFEREVIGERIRDKIAASKKKGMWMGGVPPLGYRAQDRKLVIVEGEAEIVRFIFRRYAELGSVRWLKDESPDRSRCPAARGSAPLIEEVRFAGDSLLEGDGFEPSVPRQKDNAFRDSSFPNMRARHRRLRKRSPPPDRQK
jgi:hypothetical protein